MNEEKLRFKRGQIIDQMKALVNKYTGSKWTNEIERQYNALDGEQMQIKNQIKQGGLDAELDALAPGQVICGLSPGGPGDDVSSRTYQDAFMNLMRVGKNNVGPEIMNALQVGTASEGGNIAPTELDRGIVEYLQDFNEFRQYITVIQTSSDRDIPIESTLGSAAWTAEEGAYNESDPAFGKTTLSAFKLTRIVKVSEELVMDSIFNLMDYLARAFGKSFGLAEESAIVAGDDSGKPNGFNTAASTGVTAASATAVVASELIDLYHSLSRPYRKKAIFSMADATLAAIRKLVDSNGQFIWQPGLQAGIPDLLLGRPVISSIAMPAMTTGLDAISFGDLSYYYLAERSGRVMQVLGELYAANGQIGYRGFERIDGDLIDTNAVQNLTMA